MLDDLSILDPIQFETRRRVFLRRILWIGVLTREDRGNEVAFCNQRRWPKTGLRRNRLWLTAIDHVLDSLEARRHCGRVLDEIRRKVFIDRFALAALDRFTPHVH